MENAVDGMIMAGSVLIAIIVISLFVYLFTSMGGIAKNFQESMDDSAVQKFNDKFEKYIDNENLTPHDVVTIYNLIDEINYEQGMTVISTNARIDVANISNFLSSDKRYKCLADDVKYSSETGKIEYLAIKEVK